MEENRRGGRHVFVEFHTTAYVVYVVRCNVSVEMSRGFAVTVPSTLYIVFFSSISSNAEEERGGADRRKGHTASHFYSGGESGGEYRARDDKRPKQVDNAN